MSAKARNLQNAAAMAVAIVVAVLLLVMMTNGHFSFFEKSSQVAKPSWARCEGYVALTYDDGPNPDSTVKLLKQLEAYGMKASFFVIGKHVEEYPQLARDIAAGGHDLQNHTYDHKDLTRLSDPEVKGNLAKAESAIGGAAGQKPEFYRPPYGSTSEEVAGDAAEEGLAEVGWTLDTNDWKKENGSEKALKRSLSQMKAGDIVLMHDAGHPATVKVVPAIASILQSKHLCPGKLVKSGRPIQTWEGWSFYAQAGAWKEH